MTAYKQEVAAYQALTDQATEHFHKGHVSITLTDNTKGWYSRPDHSIQLGIRNGYNRSLPLLAHELGHHILNHDQQSSALEMEANAMGVELLQVWGWSFY
jgi:hypothetical protein